VDRGVDQEADSLATQEENEEQRLGRLLERGGDPARVGDGVDRELPANVHGHSPARQGRKHARPIEPATDRSRTSL